MNVLDLLSVASSIYGLQPLLNQLRMLDQERIFINCVDKHVRHLGQHLPHNNIKLDKARFSEQLEQNDFSDIELRRFATLPASTVRLMSNKLIDILLVRDIVTGVDPVYFDKSRVELVIDRARRSFVSELFKAIPDEVLFEKIENIQTEDLKIKQTLNRLADDIRRLQYDKQVEKACVSNTSVQTTATQTLAFANNSDSDNFVLKALIVSAGAGTASAVIINEFASRYKYMDVDDMLAEDNSSDENSKAWYQFVSLEDIDHDEADDIIAQTDDINGYDEDGQEDFLIDI